MTRSSESFGPLVVTVSASYGAGGSIVAPALADRLELPFFDRLLHSPETQSEHIIERLSDEERSQTPPGRLMSNLGHMSAGLGIPIPTASDLNPRDAMRQQIEASVNRIATMSGGVILGRGAAVVLAGRPTAFHVRLDGPVDQRVTQGMTIEGISHDLAQEHQATADRAWTKFAHRVFNRDFSDAHLYHLVLDSTAVPLPDCVEVIATAAYACWERRGCH